MTRYVALLRAVNVGGVTLLMSDLKALCGRAGFAGVRTYIASGNVVLESKLPDMEVKAALERRLEAHLGKPVGVMVRSAAEMAAILKRNPFPDADAKYSYAIFLDERVAADALETVSGLNDEEVRLGEREIYVHYPCGMGRSKLRIPAAKTGTARNMNTIAKLAAMASKP